MTRSLGLDHGDARIGVAISDELGMLAHPHSTIHVAEGDPIPKIVELVAKEKIAMIVLGMPRNMDGTYGPAAEKVRAFAEKLRAATPCPLKLWDERMTTKAAQRGLHEAGKNTKQSRGMIDKAAAVLILQGWLDAQAMLG
ncbi:MAG: Holliday junction resolvase RuvX [Chthoniobacteraceae bacterium]